MERTISVRSDWNFWDPLWRWSMLTDPVIWYPGCQRVLTCWPVADTRRKLLVAREKKPLVLRLVISVLSDQNVPFHAFKK